MGMLLKLSLIGGLLWGIGAFGAVESRYQLKPFHFESQNSLKLNLEHSYFVSSDQASYSPTGSSHLSRLSLEKSLDKKWGSGNYVFDGRAVFSPGESKLYVDISDINWQKQWLDSRWTLGRKTFEWSKADQLWTSGLWQPRFSWSLLRPEQNGLTGLFWQKPFGNNLNLALFASPIFVPDLGPQYSLVEGRFVSKNPWSVAPPRRANLPFAEDVEIYYEMDIPPLDQVFLQNSAAFQVSWDNEFLFTKFSYAYKPVNSVYHSVYLSHSRTDIPNSDARPGVTIRPEFIYHQIATGEVGLHFKSGWEYWLSSTYESPEEVALDQSQWTYRRTLDTTTVVGYVGYDFDRETMGSRKLFLSYQKLFGGDKGDGGKLRDEHKSLFSPRYEYYNAVKLGFKYLNGRVSTKTYSLLSELTYDDSQKAWAWVSGVLLDVNQSLSVSMNVDAIALLKGASPKREDGFLNDIKANDEMNFGVSYVF